MIGTIKEMKLWQAICSFTGINLYIKYTYSIGINASSFVCV